MAPKVEVVLEDDTALLIEGSHWDVETQSLYFVDAIRQSIHKYVPSTKKHTKAHIGKHVTIIVPVEGKADQFVITMNRELALIKWDGESKDVSVLKKLCEVDENTNNVLNIGGCDPSGRLWSGTMGVAENPKDDIPDEKGSLYSFQNNKVTKHLTKIGLSNGIAFNAELKKMYYIDSLKGTLDEYDFDIEKGTISNGKPIFTVSKTRGHVKLRILDGMTIDSEGNLWVAGFNQSKLLKIDPRKPETISDTIHFPTMQITSASFGGPNLDELYVTSARVPIIKGEEPTLPNIIYRVTGLNAKGFPAVKVKI